METQRYPLLIAGFFSNANGGQSSFTAIGAGTRLQWSNTIITGRGDMVLLDIVPTMQPSSVVSEATIELAIGGMQVLQNGTLARYEAQAIPRSNELMHLRQSGGQTLQFTAVGDTGNTQGAVVHIYHENKFATEEIIAARNYSDLKQRIVEFTFAAGTGNKFVQSGTFTVPANVGNVVGIEVNAWDNGSNLFLSRSTFTASIGGVTIMQNVAGNLLQNNCARPGLIFPILIRGTETIQLSADTSNAAVGNTVTFKIRLYLDNDLTGTKQYKTL